MVYKIKMMKTKLLFAFLLLAAMVHAQSNCQDTSYGTPPYVPISDLGTNISPVTGLMGGLYPNGSNNMPQFFLDSGRARSYSIVPLDANGNSDSLNGKIGFISIGLSNTTMEFSTFIPIGN